MNNVQSHDWRLVQKGASLEQSDVFVFGIGDLGHDLRISFSLQVDTQRWLAIWIHWYNCRSRGFTMGWRGSKKGRGGEGHEDGL